MSAFNDNFLTEIGRVTDGTGDETEVYVDPNCGEVNLTVNDFTITLVTGSDAAPYARAIFSPDQADHLAVLLAEAARVAREQA